MILILISFKYKIMSILIVESPAKCKKIQSFLDKSYIVKSSVGHIRTLDTKWANTDVKITDDFEPPFITNQIYF